MSDKPSVDGKGVIFATAYSAAHLVRMMSVLASRTGHSVARVHEEFTERAAIFEYEGGHARLRAESQAAIAVIRILTRELPP
jgi:hypothetical protein